MPDDPRDPNRTERLAARDRQYRDGIADYHASHDIGPASAHTNPDPEIRAQAIIACSLCDDDGYRGHVICDHIDRTQTARAGAARCREALAAKQLKLEEADQ